jgi:hypothetical protein
VTSRTRRLIRALETIQQQEYGYRSPLHETAMAARALRWALGVVVASEAREHLRDAICELEGRAGR